MLDPLEAYLSETTTSALKRLMLAHTSNPADTEIGLGLDAKSVIADGAMYNFAEYTT